jgi:hypothetical protein
LPTGTVAFVAGARLLPSVAILSVLWTSGAIALAVYLTRCAFDPRPAADAHRAAARWWRLRASSRWGEEFPEWRPQPLQSE